MKSKFRGKNFVFDDRLGERITDDVLSFCHICGDSCDDQQIAKMMPVISCLSSVKSVKNY